MPDEPQKTKTRVIVTESGRVVEVDEADIEQAGGAIGRDATKSEVFSELERQANEEAYGGIAGKIAAGAHGIASGLTLGASDVLLRSAGGGDVLKGVAEANPVIRTAGEVAGSLVGPGAAAGAGVARKVGGTKGAIMGAATEGYLVGTGSAVSHLAISDDPLTVERLVGSLSTSALLGMVSGGLAGAGGKLVEKSLRSAKKGVDAIKAGKVAADGEDAASLLTAHRARVKEVNPWLAINEGEEAALLVKSDRSIRSALNTPKTLAKNPGSALRHLEVQEQALERSLAKSDEILAKLDARDAKIARELGEEVSTLPDNAAGVQMSGAVAKRYGAFADVKVSSKKPLTVPREEAERFLQAVQAGEVSGASRKAFEGIGGLLEENRALQQRLTAMADAGKGRPAGIVEQALGGAVFGATVSALPEDMPLGGIVAPFLGAKVAGMATNLLFKRAGGAVAAAATRTSKALDMLISGAQVATKVAPPLASKVLTAVKFSADEGPEQPVKKGRADLADIYRAREKELRSQTAAMGPKGEPMMIPQARQTLGANLAGLRTQAPILADRVETLAAKRIEYLASRLPKRPDFTAVQTGPDTWRPSEMEMRRFARVVAAVEDPGAVEERLANGTLSPEDAEAYRAVYPERLQALTMQVMERLPELQRQLPYPQRLALSMLTGVPVVPALRPEILKVLQSQYAEEPGTQGGMVAPTAQPQFGSISREQPTPAQGRGASNV